MNTQDAIAALDPKHGVFIDGRGLGTDSTFDVYDPATQAVIAEVSDGSAAEAADAVTAAHSAFRDWAATAPRISTCRSPGPTSCLADLPRPCAAAGAAAHSAAP